MDVDKVLAQLRRELACLDAAILSLERVQASGERRELPPRARTGRLKAQPEALRERPRKSHHRRGTE